MKKETAVENSNWPVRIVQLILAGVLVGLVLFRSGRPITLLHRPVMELKTGDVLAALTACRETGSSSASLISLPGGSDYVRGLVLVTQGRLREGTQSLEAAYAHEPREIGAAMIGASYDQLGDTDQAVKWWNGSRESAGLLVALAEWCIQLGDQTTGREYYRRAILYLGDTWTVAHARSATYFAENSLPGELDELIARLSSLTLSDNETALLALGQAMLGQSRYIEAAVYLMRAAELEPTSVEAVRWAAQATYLAGEMPQARELIARALAMPIDHQRDYFLLGQVALVEGRLDEAFGWFEKAGNEKGRLNMARIRIRQQRPAEAVEIYRRLIETDDSPETLWEAAQIATDVPDWPQARLWLTVLIDQQPANISARRLLADACEALEAATCQADQYRAILIIEPSNESARLGLIAMGLQP